MDVIVPVALLVLGIAVIIKGGDLFVTASVAIARRARLSPAVIGGTLVSLATTMPELAVTTTASLRRNPGLAVGNAVGSAICNIGLIVGLLCVLHPMPVRKEDFRVPAWTMLATGVLLTGLTIPLRLTRPAGLLLIGCAVVFLGLDLIRRWRRTAAAPPAGAEHGAPDVAASAAPAWRAGQLALRFVAGAALVVAGSRLMVDNGVALAARMGVPPMIIGLTLVAVGTSLPELVTAVTAARKGVPELSLGNVVGANILNLTLVTGMAGAIHPLELARRTQLYNFPAMLAVFLLLLVQARTGRKLTRQEGGILLVFYGLYLAGLLVIETL